IESYRLPTWLDYVRHNQRMTQADIPLTEHALALHRGEGEPRVRRLIERPTRPAPRGTFTPADLREALTDPTRASGPGARRLRPLRKAPPPWPAGAQRR